MKQKKFLVTFALGLCALTAAHAQDNDFDLGSQRSGVLFLVRRSTIRDSLLTLHHVT